MALVRHLPSDGALAHAMGEGYSLVENLLILQAEIGHAHWSSFLRANGGKPGKPLQLRKQEKPKGLTRKTVRDALLGGGVF